jgi:hypothetical protein
MYAVSENPSVLLLYFKNEAKWKTLSRVLKDEVKLLSICTCSTLKRNFTQTIPFDIMHHSIYWTKPTVNRESTVFRRVDLLPSSGNIISTTYYIHAFAWQRKQSIFRNLVFSSILNGSEDDV